MAVEARHIDIFPSQLISHREFVKSNQGNANICNTQMDSFVPFAEPMLEQTHQLPFYQNFDGNPISAKTSLDRADSGLTYNISAPRKREREYSINDLDAFSPVSQKQKLSGFSSFLDQDMIFQFHQQQSEIDRYIAQHTEKVRMELEEQRKRQSRLLISAIQGGVVKKLNEKDEEIQRMGKLNWVLQERVKSLYVENQIWRDLAQTNEATANTLRSNLEQALAHVGDDCGRAATPAAPVEDDAESSCGSNDFARRTLVAECAQDTCLRNQIVLVAEDTEASAIAELRRALEEYLSLLVGLTRKENGLEDLVEFKWKNLGDYGKQEVCMANSWFELLSVVHMMAMLILSEANSLMIPKDNSGSGVRVVSSDCKREAVDLLLKSSGYLEFCVKNILVHMPPDIKSRLPKDLQEGVLEAISIQALGQGTEIQLGLAVDCQKATISVKRRLACELLIYYSQAYQCLSGIDMNHGYGKKHLWFIKWKFLESKAAAYYYHGLILDKGNEPSCHVSAVCCFLAAEEILAESKKACLTFSLAPPTTRSPPLWGSTRHLQQKIPEVASRKSQMYGYLLEEEKSLQALPELPDFQLSLRPDDYELPEIDPAWNTEKWEIESQTLKEHLKDGETNTESETDTE